MIALQFEFMSVFFFAAGPFGNIDYLQNSNKLTGQQRDYKVVIIYELYLKFTCYPYQQYRVS